MKAIEETRWYRVRCSEGCGNAGLIYSAGPYISGTEKDNEALEYAERMTRDHARIHRGHRVALYMDTRDTTISTVVCVDDGVRA